MILRAVLEEFGQPCWAPVQILEVGVRSYGLLQDFRIGVKVTRCRPSHTEVRIDCLDSKCRGLVKVKILSLRSGEEPFQIGLIPDLEIPASNLIRAVAFDA